MVTDVEIAKTLQEVCDAQASAEQLVSLANEHGGEDNVSAIVVRVAEMT
jgi:protein phosphatase